jgi:F-type H+-transporting ATPase subunit b
MDQLVSTFGIDWRLLAMQAVNFGLLLLILWRFVYRPVLAMIDERRAKIEEGVRTADAAERRLAEADEEGKGIIGAASREGEALVASARNRAQEKTTEILKAADEKAAATVADAAARAEETKRTALREGEREIVRAAMLAAEKIMREKK